MINKDETVKITGQSLKGRNFTLNPVNNETAASTKRPIEQTRYTACATGLTGSVNVAAATRTPIRISAATSTIQASGRRAFMIL